MGAVTNSPGEGSRAKFIIYKFRGALGREPDYSAALAHQFNYVAFSHSRR